ncbi:MAG: adhesin [Methanotrichaceae archaeon]|nr:adhesin [Methanotrichaceae archaeon]
MIEITEAAAKALERSQVEGKVIKMFLAAIDSTGANYGLALGDPENEDVILEDRGIKIHINPSDVELLRETIIDFINDERGTGFIIRGPEDDIASCHSCAQVDTCDHDHTACDHEHDCDCDCDCD